ncbi:MAG: PadR family transcriptional regulator [Anaerolineae bacterium]
MSLKHAILGFLSLQPFTGYDLKKAFDGSVRHFWSADQSQIYRTLDQIVEAGWAEVELVEQATRPNRKVYHVTPTGRAELQRWLTSPLAHREEHEPFLVQLFFASGLPDAEVEALLEREADDARAQLAVYEQIRQQYPATSRQQAFVMLTLDYGIQSTQARLTWIEQVLAQLRRGDTLLSRANN